MPAPPVAVPVEEPAIPDDGIRVSVIGYHDLAENLPETAMRIHTSKFRKQMEAIRQLSGRVGSDDFSTGEPPLIRGGNESVYEVRRVIGSGATWHQAARFAVTELCVRHDDARVGEVRRLQCHVHRDGSVRMSTELAISIKFQPSPSPAPGAAHE